MEMNNEHRPAISRESLIFGGLLYWITMLGTLVAIAGMVLGIVTENNFSDPSGWISSIWEGRDTDETWHANARTGINAGIQYIEVKDDTLIINTQKDCSGTGYILNLADGKVKKTIRNQDTSEVKNSGGAQQESDLTVEYRGPGFAIKDVDGHTIGQGSVSTDTNPYGQQGEYTILGHASGNVDDDPENEVILIANQNQSYAGQVCIVEQNGEVISRYWNPGHVYVVKLYDINNDGKQELIFGATNRDQVWGDISTPAVYAFDPTANKAEMEVPPFQGNTEEGNPEWAAFPDTEEKPLNHWYLSHLTEGDGLATLGIAIGVFSGVPALIVSALVLFRRKWPVFGILALIAALVIITSMVGLMPLPG